MERYVVTLQDLIDVRLNGVKLVVMSSGHAWTIKPHVSRDSSQTDLPTIFLTAGWSVGN